MKMESALDGVIYREPGPAGRKIERRSRKLVAQLSAWRPGTLGYLVLHEADFDRLWDGVAGGDMLGAAFEVLPFLGPDAAHFVGRIEDFTFGWIGHIDEQFGRVLLLQVIPQPHMIRLRDAMDN